MASIIKIKRSDTTAIPASLANGEFAYTTNGQILYIGANGAIEAIGGKRVPGVLTANQALVTNSTNMIDVLRVGNSTVNAVVNSLSITLSNSTVTFSVTKPSAAQVSSADYYLASDGTWKQVSPGAPSTTLNDLTDVTISSASNNDLLIFDATAGEWENHAFGNGFAFSAQSPYILALNGIIANTTGIHAVAANGVTVTTNGINVRAGTNGGLLANSTGTWVVAGSTLSVNSTGVHVNNSLSIQDLTLTGNLVVQGTVVTVDATNLSVNDSIISLARNNSADAIDIGLYGQYNDGTERFTGLIYDTSADVYELFANTITEPTTTLDTGATGYTRATLRSFLNTGAFVSNVGSVAITANSTVNVNIIANTLTLSTGLAGSSGGTGYVSYTAEDILVANTTNGFRKLSLGADGKILQSNGTALIYEDLDGGVY